MAEGFRLSEAAEIVLDDDTLESPDETPLFDDPLEGREGRMLRNAIRRLRARHPVDAFDPSNRDARLAVQREITDLLITAIRDQQRWDLLKPAISRYIDSVIGDDRRHAQSEANKAWRMERPVTQCGPSHLATTRKGQSTRPRLHTDALIASELPNLSLELQTKVHQLLNEEIKVGGVPYRMGELSIPQLDLVYDRYREGLRGDATQFKRIGLLRAAAKRHGVTCVKELPLEEIGRAIAAEVDLSCLDGLATPA